MNVNQSFNDLKIKSYKYEWTIKKFSAHINLWLGTAVNRTGTIKSPFFYVDDNHAKCHFELFTGKSNNGTYFDIKLFLVSDQNSSKPVKIVWTIVNNTTKSNSDEKIIYHTINHPYFSSSPAQLGGIPAKLLPVDTGHSDYDISIICHFYIVADSFTSAINNSVSRMTKSNLSIDIVELFNNKKFTDIAFILGDKRIQAHKTILMARSPVFAAMFSHSMKEKNDNEVQIDDIDYEVLEEMLRYIYTDDVSNLKCPATKLLYAAEKYGLKDLTETCGELLQKEITIDNAAEIFIIADRHNLPQLLEQIRNLIRGHIEEFLNSPGYEHMVEKYPKLAIKVFKLPASKV